LTEDVSIAPTPNPISSRPGTKDTNGEFTLTRASSSAMPATVSAKPTLMSQSSVVSADSRFAVSSPVLRVHGHR